MIEADRQMQEEILRLTKDSNHVLHSMRRNAFLAGIFKFIFYILILVVAPLWLYSTYLAPIMQEAIKTMNQVQGTGTKAQGQINILGDTIKQLEAKLPGILQAKQ